MLIAVTILSKPHLIIGKWKQPTIQLYQPFGRHVLKLNELRKVISLKDHHKRKTEGRRKARDTEREPTYIKNSKRALRDK